MASAGPLRTGHLRLRAQYKLALECPGLCTVVDTVPHLATFSGAWPCGQKCPGIRLGLIQTRLLQEYSHPRPKRSSQITSLVVRFCTQASGIWKRCSSLIMVDILHLPTSHLCDLAGCHNLEQMKDKCCGALDEARGRLRSQAGGAYYLQ